MSYLRQHFPQVTWTFYTQRKSDATDWTANVIVTADEIEAAEWQADFKASGTLFTLIRSEFDGTGAFECARDVTDDDIFSPIAAE